MVSPLIVVSINPPKTTRGLDALSLTYTSFLQKHIAFNIESDMICLMSRRTTWFKQKLISLEIHPNFICYLFLSLPGCLTFVKINKMLHFKGSLSVIFLVHCIGEKKMPSNIWVPSKLNSHHECKIRNWKPWQWIGHLRHGLYCVHRM